MNEEILKLLSKKIYLGDSVYAHHDGYHIILTTENGYQDDPRNTIALEPSVLSSLNNYNTYIHESVSKIRRDNQSE